jgi:hypothetical protein
MGLKCFEFFIKNALETSLPPVRKLRDKQAGSDFVLALLSSQLILSGFPFAVELDLFSIIPTLF